LVYQRVADRGEVVSHTRGPVTSSHSTSPAGFEGALLAQVSLHLRACQLACPTICPTLGGLAKPEQLGAYVDIQFLVIALVDLGHSSQDRSASCAWLISYGNLFWSSDGAE